MSSKQKQKSRTITFQLTVAVKTDFMEGVVTDQIKAIAMAMNKQLGTEVCALTATTEYKHKKDQKE